METKANIINPTSERSILSIILTNNDSIVDVEDFGVFTEHFGISAHKYVFMSMAYLYSKQIKITPMAILEVINDKEAKKQIEELGGLEYLLLLQETQADKGSLKIFCQKVLQAHTRRSILNVCDEVSKFIISEKSEVLNPKELVGKLEEKISDINAGYDRKGEEFYKMGTHTDEILEERASSPNTVMGIETGFPQLDEYTNGGVPGDLFVVIGESKTGKSTILTNWATKMAVFDKMPVGYFDTEMKAREQEDRILANLSGVPHKEILNGMFIRDTEFGKGKDKTERLMEAKKLLQKSEYYHVYMPQINIETMFSNAKRLKIKKDIQALFIDYIKIPSGGASGLRGAQEYQLLGYLTGGMKELAGIIDVPVYTAGQTNRTDLGNTDKDASSIGGSYRILQLATKLMFLTNKSNEQIAREGRQNGNQVLAIKYQRNAESDCPPINIEFTRNILRQEEII